MAEPAATPAGGDENVDGEQGAEDVELEAIADELAEAEAFVEERVQRALAPYRGKFPPAVLEEYADDLRCHLLTHPVACRMLARIRPRAVRVTSGEGAIMDGAGDAPDAPIKAKLG
jgi:hypothetical protein